VLSNAKLASSSLIRFGFQALGPWTCRCRGALAPLLKQAIVVEDVSLQGVSCSGELLAALRPAAGTLKKLDTTDLPDIVRPLCCFCCQVACVYALYQMWTDVCRQ
jgi:hypothetical protein